MHMFKKLVLVALLVPSSLIVTCEPPVEQESILNNLYNAGPGFKEGLRKLGIGFYRLALDGSRATLSASKGADVAGDFFAEHYWALGAGTAAILTGLGYLYFKRPTRPHWMHRQWVQDKVRGMWHNGRFWVSPDDAI